MNGPAAARTGSSTADVLPIFQYEHVRLYEADCLEWLASCAEHSIHAVVTDPPYGLVEYQPHQQAKMRNGRGGVWRIPPSYDGFKRSPLPRFTTLSASELTELERFFETWAKVLFPVLVPGAHVLIASNPLVSYLVSGAVARAGFERRGEVVRLVMTMRGGDRPKGAHDEFADVTVMPRSMWEPWLLFRRPIHGRVQDNLRKWKTGALRRVSPSQPFGDVIRSSPTRASERQIADHPSLKPQAFMRQIVRAVLPLGEGVVLDPFAGSGSTLAAAQAVGYEAVGTEIDPHYIKVACDAIPKLARLATANGCSPEPTRMGKAPDGMDLSGVVPLKKP
jgi:DNA modification methylase